MYRYLNIRFDEKYSEFIPVETVIQILRSIPTIKQDSPIKFVSSDNFAWGLINLLQCDSEGNYVVQEGKSFEKINLIEFIFSDDEKSFQEFFEISLDIAKKINWEVFDSSDEIILQAKSEIELN